MKSVMTHTNHQPNYVMEYKHLPLPRSVTNKVRELLASGVMERVLDGKLQDIDFFIFICLRECCGVSDLTTQLYVLI